MDEHGTIAVHDRGSLLIKAHQLVTSGPPEGFNQDQIQTKQHWIGRSCRSCRWESTAKIVRESGPLVPHYTIAQIITYHHAWHGGDLITYQCRTEVNKVRHFPRNTRHLPVSFQNSGTSGIMDSPQSPTNPFSWSSAVETGGRPRGFWAYCTVHVATNNSHNASGNPDVGLSG